MTNPAITTTVASAPGTTNPAGTTDSSLSLSSNDQLDKTDYANLQEYLSRSQIKAVINSLKESGGAIDFTSDGNGNESFAVEMKILLFPKDKQHDHEKHYNFVNRILKLFEATGKFEIIYANDKEGNKARGFAPVGLKFAQGKTNINIDELIEEVENQQYLFFAQLIGKLSIELAEAKAALRNQDEVLNEAAQADNANTVLHSKVEVLEVQIAALEAQVARLQEELSDATSGELLAQKDAQIAELTARLAASTAENELLRSENTQISAKNAGLKKQLDTQTQRANAEREKTEALAREAAVAEARVAQADAVITGLNEMLNLEDITLTPENIIRNFNNANKNEYDKGRNKGYEAGGIDMWYSIEEFLMDASLPQVSGLIGAYVTDQETGSEGQKLREIVGKITSLRAEYDGIQQEKRKSKKDLQALIRIKKEAGILADNLRAQVTAVMQRAVADLDTQSNRSK
jgi:hypothetical protein